eukprot:3746119-Rhodomonas_salina.2
MLSGTVGVGGEAMLLSEGEAEVKELMKAGRASIWDLAWKLAQTQTVAVEQRRRLVRAPTCKMHRRGCTSAPTRRRVGDAISRCVGAALTRWRLRN